MEPPFSAAWGHVAAKNDVGLSINALVGITNACRVNGRARGMVTLYTELTQTCDVLHLVPASHTHTPGTTCRVCQLGALFSNLFCDSSTLIDIATSREGDPIQYSRTMLRRYSVNTVFRTSARGQSTRANQFIWPSPLPPEVPDVVPTQEITRSSRRRR
jgi:hypothetical protein